MSDFERYGDYNEYDGEGKGKSSFIMLIIKLAIALACISVVAILGARIFLFNYYPEEIKELYYTDTLTEYYNATDGEMDVLSQSYPYMYDDPDEGNFFGGNVLVIRGAGMIQFSIRYNNSTLEKLGQKYGKEITAEDLIFTLERNPVDDDGEAMPIGTLEYHGCDTVVMYCHNKLVFSGIDFGKGDCKIAWLRVRITIKDTDLKDDEYVVPVYQDHANYSKFDEYKPDSDEVPKE